MKKILGLLALVLCVSVVANGQGYMKIWNAKTYAINQNDTSVSVRIAAYPLSSLWIKYDDSVNVITLVQYSKDLGATWSFIFGDTLNQTGGGTITGSTYREVALRTATVDKYAGVAGLVRVVQNFQATLCGVTTPTYRAWFVYHP